MTDLRTRLKAKRQSEAPPELHHHSDFVTPRDVAYRNKRAASTLANTHLLCSVCEINHTTFKYFLTRKSHFPICGNCMFNTDMNKVKGMKRDDAIQFLKTTSH